MRVLVTGHKGYIGTVLAPMVAERGHDVVGLDTDLFERCTFKETTSEILSIRKDIRDMEAADVKGFDAIIHLAGLSNDPLGNLNPELTYQINYRASLRMAELAREVGVSRFLFSSSCSTYGAAGENILDESASFNPVTPYAESKVLVEQEVSKLASDNFSPVFLRNATAYGVSPRMRFDLVLNNLVAWAVTTGNVLIKSDGTPWRPIVHIEDISNAFIAALEAPREQIHNVAVNVGRSDENYRIRDLANIVKDIVPGCKIEYAEDAGPDSRCYRVDFSKIEKILPNFKPQWNARVGAQQLYDSYKNANLRVEDFEGTRFRRIDQLQSLIAAGHLDSTLRWSKHQASARAIA